jgi:hypothetical protein
MASNAPLPKAEAQVMVRDFGTEAWRPSLDFDPVVIPVESLNTADVYDSTVMGLVDAIVEAETSEGHPQFEYMLVWSKTGHAVKGVCPECDDVFIVSEGFTKPDTFNGDAAVMCGCLDD